MPIIESFPPGGDNGHPQRFELAAGDTLRARLKGIIDFVERGVVITVLPADGAALALSMSATPDLADKVAHEDSPIEEAKVIHQTTPFQSLEAAATGGAVTITFLWPARQGAAKLVRL